MNAPQRYNMQRRTSRVTMGTKSDLGVTYLLRVTQSLDRKLEIDPCTQGSKL